MPGQAQSTSSRLLTRGPIISSARQRGFQGALVSVGHPRVLGTYPSKGDQRGVGPVPPTSLRPAVLAGAAPAADSSRNLSPRGFQGSS